MILLYIIKRILLIIPVVLGITFFIYVILAFAPGDPVLSILGPEATAEEIAAKRHEMGLDQNVVIRYTIYMKSVLQGDLGRSWLNSKPVMLEFSQRFPNTLFLAVLASVLMAVLGIPLGTISAIKQNSFIDGITLIFALFFASMPTFWCALMMQLFFSLKFGWLPAMGIGTFKHMILPAASLGLWGLASQIRIMRSTMLDVIGMDYIRTARAKGANEFRVIFNHALRNGLMPAVTNLGVTFASFFGGAIVTETVFSLPGIATYLMNAVKGRDVPVVMGVIIFVAFIVALINLIVDLVYVVIDPRVKPQ